MTKRATQARRPRQFAFRIEHEHRAGIKIKVGLKDGRCLAGARPRDGDLRPVVEIAEEPAREFAENDLPRHEGIARKFVRSHPVIDRRSIRDETRQPHAARQRAFVKVAAATLERRQSQISLRVGQRKRRCPFRALCRPKPAHLTSSLVTSLINQQLTRGFRLWLWESLSNNRTDGSGHSRTFQEGSALRSEKTGIAASDPRRFEHLIGASCARSRPFGVKALPPITQENCRSRQFSCVPGPCEAP